YAQALRSRPDWITPLAGLLALQRKAPPAELVEKAEALQRQAGLDDRDRALLGYALGKIQDSRGTPEAAMVSWHDANAARRRTSGEYDRAGAEAGIERLMDTFDQAFFERPSRPAGSRDERPVFVVGM